MSYLTGLLSGQPDLAPALRSPCATAGGPRPLVNIVVNAILSLLQHPGMTLDEVFEANWDADEDHDTAAEMVRSWWDW